MAKYAEGSSINDVTRKALFKKLPLIAYVVGHPKSKKYIEKETNLAS